MQIACARLRSILPKFSYERYRFQGNPISEPGHTASPTTSHAQGGVGRWGEGWVKFLSVFCVVRGSRRLHSSERQYVCLHLTSLDWGLRVQRPNKRRVRCCQAPKKSVPQYEYRLALYNSLHGSSDTSPFDPSSRDCFLIGRCCNRHFFCPSQFFFLLPKLLKEVKSFVTPRYGETRVLYSGTNALKRADPPPAFKNKTRGSYRAQRWHFHPIHRSHSCSYILL